MEASASKQQQLHNNNNNHQQDDAAETGWRMPIEVFLASRKSRDELHGLRQRRAVRDYYESRNLVIDSFEEAERLLLPRGGPMRAGEGGGDEGEGTSGQTQLRMSLAVNVALLCVKATLSVLSGSLSLITSALDSLLDIASGTILFVTSRAIIRPQPMDKYRFPVGKRRMEPLGIIVFSSIMGTIGFSVLVEGVRQFVGEAHLHHLEDLTLTVALMLAVIAAKLALFAHCRHSTLPHVQILARDHLNDVGTNSFGLLGAVLGDRLYFWFDPLVAMLLAAYICASWGRTAYEVRPVPCRAM